MLKSLIDRIFANKQDEIFSLLQKHGFEKFLSGFIAKIDEIEISDVAEYNHVTSLSSTFLTRINSVLENVSNVDDKEQLEHILGEISNELIFRIVQKGGVAKNKVLTIIKDALITTCSANGWNADELFKMIKLDLFHSLTVKTEISLKLDISKSNNTVHYYEWLRDEILLDQIAHDLKDMKIVKSVAEFKGLFGKHDGFLRVRMNREKLDFIFILFDQLKGRNYIKMRGSRGYFTPLKEFGVDFEKNVLIKRPPKRIKEAIIKNEAKHRSLLEKIDQLLCF